MKILLYFAFGFALVAMSHESFAQQWSDVSLGISPSPPYTTTNPTFTMDMAIYNTIPHVLIHTTGNNLAVMTYSTGVWTTLPTPTPPASANASGAKIAIDASGTIYVAYYTQAGNSLQVKKYNGTAWVTVGALGFASNDGPQAFMIDPATNFPVIITRNQTGTFNLSAYRFNGTSWGIIGAAGFTPYIDYSRAAVSPTGTPYVLYNSAVGKFSVMKFDGANWVLVGPASFGDFSGSSLGTDIAVDATGAPYVITQSTTTLKSSVLKYNGTAWVSVGATDFTPGAAHQARLNFNGTGSLHMVFQDATSGNKITAMRYNGTAWVGVGSPAFSGGGGRWPIIDFDASNTPFVLFHDALLTNNNGSLMKLCALNTATVTSTTPGVLCGAGPITLSAVSAGTLRWYNAATNGAFVGTGSSFVTPNLTNTTSTYSVAAYDAAGCSSPRTTVTATAKPIPAITATQPGGACAGGTASIGATSDLGTISWYTTLTGGSPFASGVGSGSVVTTPVVNTTTAFYAEAVNNGCISAARTAVQAIVNPTPPAPTANDGSRCGTGIVTISVTASPGTVQWFAASSGGSSLGSGNSFITPSLTTTTTFYALLTGIAGCPALTRTPVVAQVKTIPTVTSTTPASRCGAGTVTLSATLSDVGAINWYDAASGGNLAGSNNFTTPSLTATTTYYAEAVANGCSSASRTAVVATIKPIPTITASNVSRCGPGTVALTASSDGAMSWFAANTGGSALTTGTNFTTPSITTTTPYFLEATLNGCTTPTRTSVSAVVNPIPALPTISANNTPAAPVLTSSSSTGNQWYLNGNAISGETNTTLSITQAGTYKVQVQVNDCISDFSTDQSFVTQTITFGALADKVLGDTPFALTGTASSGLPLSYTASSNKVSITSNQISLVSAGRVTITASQSGGIGFIQAASVNQSFCIRPAKPSIAISNTNPESPTLTSSASAGNQWFLNDTAIAGATNTTLSVTQIGTYKVKVQIDDCVSDFSDDLAIVITGDIQKNTGSINIYPNPLTDWLTVKLGNSSGQKGIAIYQLTGKKMTSQQISTDEAGFYVADYTNGIYVVKITTGDAVSVIRFVKQ